MSPIEHPVIVDEADIHVAIRVDDPVIERGGDEGKQGWER